jgi:hypothetical protein
MPLPGVKVPAVGGLDQRTELRASGGGDQLLALAAQPFEALAAFAEGGRAGALLLLHNRHDGLVLGSAGLGFRLMALRRYAAFFGLFGIG